MAYRTTAQGGTGTSARVGRRYRCLVLGCWQYGHWLPVERPGEDERHYLTEHYQPDPTATQPHGTHPDALGALHVRPAA